MSNEARSAAALRISIRATIGTSNAGDPESLRNINTALYSDGAMCFVIENAMLYRLAKASTATADNVVIVQPVGGPGRWVQMAQGPGAASSIDVVASSTTNTAATAGSGNFVGITGSAFGFQPSGSVPGWSLTAAGCILTYSGLVPVTVQARLECAVSGLVEAGSVTIYGGIAYNNDLVGGNAAGLFAGVMSVSAREDDIETMALTRKEVLSPGDTLRPILATAGLASLSISRMILSVDVTG